MLKTVVLLDIFVEIYIFGFFDEQKAQKNSIYFK